MALDKEHKYVNEITQQEHDDTANIELKKVGGFGWNADSLEWKRLQVDANGKLNVNATATIDTSEIATSAIQTDGTQKTQVVNASNTPIEFATETTLNDAKTILNSIDGNIGLIANANLATEATLADVNTAQTDGTQKTQIIPKASGGYSTFHLVSAASTNATVVKASAGQLYGWYIYNSNASARKIAFHNASTEPTAGTSLMFSIVIPGTSGANVFNDVGVEFTTGISITTVTELADAGTTGVAAEDLIINLFYF